MRQNIVPNPEVRQFEAYMSFAGGHNSEISNDRLRDDEFQIMENVDLSGRVSAKRRTGRTSFLTLANPGQGHFFFYRADQTEPAHIFASGGLLFTEVGGLMSFISMKVGGSGIIPVLNVEVTSVTHAVDGYFTLFVRGLSYRINILATDNTTAKIAEKIRATFFPGWVTGGTGSNVTFTSVHYFTVTATSITYALGTVSAALTVTVIEAGNNGTIFEFQKERPVEAVQFGTTLYIATGTKLVQLTYEAGTWVGLTVEPYRPTVQEALYIGTNGLADNPGAYVSDGISADLAVAGLVPATRSGAVNMNTAFTAYINKPGSITSVDYKWEYRSTGSTTIYGAVSEVAALVVTAGCTTNGNVTVTLDGIPYFVPLTTTQNTATLVATAIRGWQYYGWIASGSGTTVQFDAVVTGAKVDTTYSAGSTGAAGTMTTTKQGVTGTTWKLGRDWTTGTTGKTYNFNVDTPGNYDVQVSARDTATPGTVVSANISGYQIDSVLNRNNNEQDTSGIQTCNRIRLHWDRLLLFGDTQNSFLMYISDLQTPKYFPVNMILSFDTGKLEAINSVVRFQDYLVVMTNTTIQTLIGKDPSTYSRFVINETIGCIAPLSAAVVGNQVMFLSYDGVTALRPNPYRIEVMNVKRIDVQIHSEVLLKLSDTKACAIFHDNQYWLCFPASRTIYRFYHEFEVWVRDKSSKLNITQFTSYGGRVYNITTGTNVLIHSGTTWEDDGEVYDMLIDAKMYDLGYSFNNKKMRRLYMIGRHFGTNTNLYVKVYADSSLIITPDDGQAVVINNGTDTVWQVITTPNVHFYAGTVVGTWTLGLNPLGDIQLSVQRVPLQGKCRRVRVNIRHSENAPCEIYGFGFEFKLKKV